jgi:spore coat protein CotH
MMLLLNNGDDISGPGNNAYLYYDPAASTFTVVPWDMNLALGGMMGAPGGPTFQSGPGGDSDIVPGEGAFVVIDGTPVPGDVIMQGPDNSFQGTNGPIGGRGGIGGINNPLVTRWDDDADFAVMQTEAQDRLKAELFESGTAAEILARWVTVLETHATDLVDQSTIDSESQSLKEQIDAA